MSISSWFPIMFVSFSLLLSAEVIFSCRLNNSEHQSTISCSYLEETLTPKLEAGIRFSQHNSKRMRATWDIFLYKLFYYYEFNYILINYSFHSLYSFIYLHSFISLTSLEWENSFASRTVYAKIARMWKILLCFSISSMILLVKCEITTEV